jgi:ligand-binding sensor domain-containing protein/two-component sensor histidine kinase
MTTRITFILIILTSLLFRLQAQPFAQDVNIQLIGPEQGLPDRNTRCIVQDKIGFLWLGTRTGLYRYDGYSFENYNHLLLEDSTERYTVINDLKIDNKGRLWVAHENGLAVIDPVLLSSRKINLKKYFPQKILSPFTKRVYFDRDNNPWVVWTRGLVKFRNDISPLFVYISRNSPVNPGSGFDISLFHDDQKGNIYLYDNPKNLEIINKNGGFKTILPLPVIEQKQKKFFPQFAFEKTDSTLTFIFAGSGSQSISAEYNLNKMQVDRSEKPILPVFAPAYIFPDKQGNIWQNNFGEIGYVSKLTGRFFNLTGMVRNKAGEQLTFFNQTVSNDNTIWFCTGSGLVKIYLNPSLFQTYLNLPLKNANDVGTSIRGITEDENGKIWICSYGYTYSGEMYTLHTLDTERNIIAHNRLYNKDHERIFALLMKAIFVKENIFAVTDGTTLLKINRKTFQTDIIEFTNATGSQFTNIAAINDSILWLATLNGMVAYNMLSGQKVIFNDKKEDDVIKNFRVNYFLKAANNTYWACTLKGIYLLNEDGKILKHYGSEENVVIPLPESNISSMCLYDNKLWASTFGGGLLSIDTASKKVKQYTTENGLPHNVVYSVLPDDLGNLWMSTNNGLCRFNILNETIHNYGLLDGLPHYEFNSASFLKSRNGRMYFGGLNGFVSFDPKKIDTSKQLQAPLHLVSFSKYEQGTDSLIIFNGNQLSKDITISPGDRSFSFTFMTPDYRSTAQNKFRYKLEGWNDEGWHIFETGNKLSFNSIPAGDYTLRVQVAVAGSNWSKNEWTTSLTVKKPFYNEWWFYVLSLITVAGIVYAFYRYRLNELIRIQNIRNRISADMHDEIGSTLSSISFYSQALLMQTGDEKHRQVLGKIKENAQQVQENLSDIIWSVKASMDEMENVFSRMQRFGSEFLDSKNILFHFEVDEKMNHTKLDMAYRKNFYLIFKEALNNAAKYAQCKNVWVNITHGGSHATMKIRDDGKGFDTLTQTEGNGLSNMRERAMQMKGSLTVDSNLNAGTTVILIF